MRRIMILAIALLFIPAFAYSTEKPRTRATAENRTQNIERYKLGGFGANANATLGIQVKYQTDGEQGVTIQNFEVDSPANNAGMIQYDWILEVDGSPVGLIRNRYYELWPRYGRAGANTTEVLVSFLNNDGKRKYYYSQVSTAKVEGVIIKGGVTLPPDFFTSPKPITRADAEFRDKNIARYVYGYSNFSTYGRFELGADVNYSYGSGATIEHIKNGKAAQRSGLKVGDCILEVDGAPVGKFGDRLYEVWRQYIYSPTRKVEFLICFEDESTGELRYFYPEIELDDLTRPN